MLQQLQLQRIKVDSPAVIEIDNGISIHIDANRNVFIDGHNKLIMRSVENIEMDAKNIHLNAKENVYIGSGKNITQQAPRIDLNPLGDESGHRGSK